MTSSVFDDMIAGTPTADQPTEQAAEGTENAETNASEWPKTLTLPAGEAPEGAVPVAEFSKLVNQKVVEARVQELLTSGKSALEAAMEAMTAQVNQASFYQAVKGQRNALPHYVVRYEVDVTDDEGKPTGEKKTDEKVFIPVEVGMNWWENRPTRGGAGASSSEEDLKKRLFRAGKKAANLAKAEERLTRLTETVKTMREQLDSYIERLSADGKTLDDAKAAYEASEEANEEANAITDENESE